MNLPEIVVVGNGTAGVICASFLKTYWKERAKIILIHDSSKGVIGVGESTTPAIFDYLRFIGISTLELLKFTNTTLKLGIKFKNWKNDNKHFYHNFAEPNIPDNSLNKTYFLSSAYSILNNSFDNDLYLQNYFTENHLLPKEFPNDILHALHIDAYKFSQYILEKFKSKIQIIDSAIENVMMNDGSIDYLVLKNEQKIKANLYIDATGFSKILIKEMNPEWVDKKKYLPLDRAIPTSIENTHNYIPTYTLAESTKNGWTWQIPLQDRYGSGYLYSSEFTSDDEAFLEYNKWIEKNHKSKLTTDKIIKYNTGYFKDQWIGNCIAIGLSSGFIEPLESTAIHTSIRQTFYIANFYNLKINEFSRKKYNQKIRNVYETIFDYIRLHYYTKRTDSPFHSYMNENTPEWIAELEEKVNDNFINHYDFYDNDDLFTTINYITLLNGLNLIKNKDGIKNYLSNNNFYDISKSEFLQIKEIKKINRMNSIDHKKFIEIVKNS